jgi:hypothetical protein
MRQKDHVTKMREGAEKAEETIQRIYKAFDKKLPATGKRHDYEPSEESHPMHTDPVCNVCGSPKGDHNGN